MEAVGEDAAAAGLPGMAKEKPTKSVVDAAMAHSRRSIPRFHADWCLSVAEEVMRAGLIQIQGVLERHMANGETATWFTQLLESAKPRRSADKIPA